MTKRKLHITQKNLKKIAILLFICIIIILVWTGFRISQKISDNIEQKNRDNEEISTSMPVDLATKITESFISDYTNPTSKEMVKAYERYGYDKCRFTSKGLIVFADEYDGTPERLFTNVWFDDGVLKNILKPNVGEIDVMEIANNPSYVYITLKNVDKKEIEAYAEEVKEEYKNENKQKKSKTYIYYGTNESGDRVIIDYYENRSVDINYYFK